MARSQENGHRWIILLAIIGFLLGRFAGAWLVVDAPQKADLIVVLAGETEQRPTRGEQLLEQGFAPRMLLDVPAAAHIYHQDQMEIARQFLNSSPQAAKLAACPITGPAWAHHSEATASAVNPRNLRPARAMVGFTPSPGGEPG